MRACEDRASGISRRHPAALARVVLATATPRRVGAAHSLPFFCCCWDFPLAGERYQSGKKLDAANKMDPGGCGAG